jgi:hypothetical protein
VILTKYHIEKQPKPYSQCTKGLVDVDSYHSDTYKQLMSFYKNKQKPEEPEALNRKFHYLDCINMCFQKYLGEFCQCQDPFYEFVYYDSMPFCIFSNQNHTDCMYNVYRSSSKTSLDKCDCPLECEASGYTYSISFAEFPTLNYYRERYLDNQILKTKFIQQNIELNFENARKSIARVVIFYNDFKDTKITEEVKTKLFDLLSQIGGTLGLFLGFSCLSMIEFLEVLLQAIVIVFNHYSKKMRNIKEET